MSRTRILNDKDVKICIILSIKVNKLRMADFKYDSYDQTAIKVSFEHLRQTEQKGFWYGALVGVPLGAWFIRSASKGTRLPLPWAFATSIPLLAGSTIYGLYTWSARNAYAETASKVNRKYSKIINKIINY